MAWNQKKYEARTALSTIIERPLRIRVAEKGSANWKSGLLEIVDDQTGELLATTRRSNLFEQKTEWQLRADC